MGIKLMFLLSAAVIVVDCSQSAKKGVEVKNTKAFVEAPAECKPSEGLKDFAKLVLEATARQRANTPQVDSKWVEAVISDQGATYLIKFYRNNDILQNVQIEETRPEGTLTIHDYCADGTVNVVESSGNIEYSDGSQDEEIIGTDDEWWVDFKYRKVRGIITERVESITIEKRH